MIAVAETFNQRAGDTMTKFSKPRGHEYHEAVMLAEVVKSLAPAPGRIIVDGTLGGGGHTAALLAAGARVIGLDQDPAALAFAEARLGSGGGNFRAVRGNFADIRVLLGGLGVGQIDGALLREQLRVREFSGPPGPRGTDRHQEMTHAPAPEHH